MRVVAIWPQNISQVAYFPAQVGDIAVRQGDVPPTSGAKSPIWQMYGGLAAMTISLFNRVLVGLGGNEGGSAMKTLKRLTATVALAAVGVVAAVPGAFGSAAPTASCVGAGSSAVSPGQALYPFSVPGERATIAHDVQALAAGAGTAPGQFMSESAHAHGTAPVCFPGGPP